MAFLPALLAAALVLVSWTSAARAQTTEIEMLSKADAKRIFGMTRQQWDGNISAMVARGVAERTYPSSMGLIGMVMQTPEAIVITRLDYSKGDARPAFAQMSFSLPPSWTSLFTDDAAAKTIADIRKQLAPEFDVDGRMERLRAGPAFFFIITERDRKEREVTSR